MSIEEIIELFQNNKGCKIQKEYIIEDMIMKFSTKIKDGQSQLNKQLAGISIGNPEEDKVINDDIAKNKIIFIIPFEMPNAGKSHLWKLI